jgi:hypothetical protein
MMRISRGRQENTAPLKNRAFCPGSAQKWLSSCLQKILRQEHEVGDGASCSHCLCLLCSRCTAVAASASLGRYGKELVRGLTHSLPLPLSPYSPSPCPSLQLLVTCCGRAAGHVLWPCCVWLLRRSCLVCAGGEDKDRKHLAQPGGSPYTAVRTQ